MSDPIDPRTIAVLGATGRTGRRVVEYALADGVTVRALARAPEMLADLAHQRLHVVEGDAEDASAIARLVDGADAVISAIGGGSTADPGTTRSTAARHVAGAMEARGTPEARFLAVAGGGILDAPGGGLRHDQPSFPAVFRAVSAEHRRVWETVRDGRLAWTMVCTGDIVPGERTGVYRTLPDVMPEGGRRISIEDLADYLLAELRDGRFVRRRVGLTY
jgi:putative NADH-flavin reductase